ncbi:hypothetical protein ABZ439_13865 [Streptomyces sp. NPDC005840]|uniref:hypothetical protein n=1 Tax=Streptomyces sp. NPDC005840 TaxID=3157072 RepID=UPI00340CDF80
MTKKTRIRVARIAAGAVIAVGASVTAAGVAAADEDDCGLLGICVTPTPTPTDTGLPTGPTEPTDDPTEPTEEPTEPTEQPTEPTEEPTQPTEQPTEPTEEPTSGSPTAGNGSGGGTGGNNQTDPNGGSSAQEAGTSALTDTRSDTSPQGGGDELAETGAAQTTFLVIGAATMIAGGIGFRILPRLVGGRGGAAA